MWGVFQVFSVGSKLLFWVFKRLFCLFFIYFGRHELWIDLRNRTYTKPMPTISFNLRRSQTVSWAKLHWVVLTAYTIAIFGSYISLHSLLWSLGKNRNISEMLLIKHVVWIVFSYLPCFYLVSNFSGLSYLFLYWCKSAGKI
jgi:hypothetical protein